MKKPSITAGEWRLGIKPGPYIYGDNGTQVAACDMITNFAVENIANSKAIVALPKLLEALEKLEAIGSGGVAMIHETGKPTWSALDEVKRITREALAAAGYTE